jgi:hypothetical protein
MDPVPFPEHPRLRWEVTLSRRAAGSQGQCAVPGRRTYSRGRRLLRGRRLRSLLRTAAPHRSVAKRIHGITTSVSCRTPARIELARDCTSGRTEVKRLPSSGSPGGKWLPLQAPKEDADRRDPRSCPPPAANSCNRRADWGRHVGHPPSPDFPSPVRQRKTLSAIRASGQTG